jgi:hypothetical protein
MNQIFIYLISFEKCIIILKVSKKNPIFIFLIFIEKWEWKIYNNSKKFKNKSNIYLITIVKWNWEI